MVYPNGGGNGGGYSTFEIPTTNINSINGSFNVGAYPVQATFSNDDRLLYHGTASQGVVKVFDATTFNQIGTIPIGNSPGTGFPYTVRDLVVDRSGRWLFVATTDDFSSAKLRVYDTGRMDPVPAARLGNIATRLRVQTDENVLIGGFIITRECSQEGDHSRDRIVLGAVPPRFSGRSNAGAPSREFTAGQQRQLED